MSAQTPVTRTSFVRDAARRGAAGLLAPLEALLAGARDPAAPVVQRLRLAGAFAHRVDALFQMRGTELRAREGGERAARARARLRALTAELHALLERELLPALGVGLRGWRDLREGERRALSPLFLRDVAPLLTPLTVDATHPFPCVASLALNVAVLVREPRGRAERYIGIEVPPGAPRLLAAPSGALAPIEEIVGGHLANLLPGFEVLCHHAFRVTRDGRPLRARALGAGGGARTRAAVRLELDAATPPELRALLAAGLGLDPGDLDESSAPLDLAAVVALPVARCLGESARRAAPRRIEAGARARSEAS